MKKQEGITLIALVITIIVLLILAGVTIAMLTGDNGLLTRTQDSVAKNAIAGAKDEVMLVYNDVLAQYLEAKYTGGTAVDLATTFASEVNGLSAPKKHDCTVSASGTTVTISYTNNGKTTTATGTLTTTAGSESFKWD